MQNAKQYITETEDGYELCITLDNEQCAGVDVESITMFISNVNEAEDGDEAILGPQGLGHPVQTLVTLQSKSS